MCLPLPHPPSLYTVPFLSQLMTVVAPKRYHEQLMDAHNPGVLVVFLDFDQGYTASKAVRSSHYVPLVKMFYATVFTLGWAAPPVLLYITWRKQMAVLQQIQDTRGGPAVMWACIAWMPLANLYITVKYITSRSAGKLQLTGTVETGMVVAYPIIFSSIAAVIQSGKALPGLPNTSVLRNAIVRRMIKFYMWCNFDFLVAMILAKSPFAVVLVGTNPFLYGSALLAIVLAASLPILLTATLFTIGQVFLGDPDFRLTWREAAWQAGWLLLVATGCMGVILFLGCICFLLLLSKDGNKVQSVSGVASFFMTHVVLTALPLLMHSLIRFIRKIRV